MFRSKTKNKSSVNPFNVQLGRSIKNPRRNPWALAIVLVGTFAIAGGVFFFGRSYAATIDPNTWAPTVPGVYFFDRSNQTGNAQKDVSARESQFGRKFDGHLYYLPANVTTSSLADAHWSLTTDKVPFVTLSWSTGSNPNSIIPDIAAGKYDTDINNFANAVKSQLSPYGRTFIRPFWEFNYTGSEWNDVHYGNNPAEFIKAWQHFVDIFRADNVTNVKWLWNPIRIGGTASQNPVSYYPGSNYVDWIGLDSYPKNSYMSLYQLATTSSGSSFDWYDTFKSYGKPMMFGEVGIQPSNAYSGGAPTRNTWWNDAVTELKTQMPDVRAFEYFDSNAGTNWMYDAPGSVSGDSGAQALTAAENAANNCYMDTLSTTCGGVGTPPPPPTPAPVPTPAPTPTPTPTPTPKPPKGGGSGGSGQSSGSGSSSGSSTGTSGSVTLKSTEDTYIYKSKPSQNYGKADPLHVAGYNLRALLRFNTSNSVPSGDKVTNVKLKLYTTQNAATKGGYEVHTESDSWKASTVTWSNQPSWNDSVLTTSSTPKTGSWVTINLPVSALKSNGNTDLGVRYSVGANVVTEFHSAESSTYAPQLIVSYAPNTAALSHASKLIIALDFAAGLSLMLLV